jgi:hypothetical protein
MEDIPNLDELFNTYDIILPKFNLGWSSIKRQYANSHNIEDLEIIENIIKEDYPDYYETALSTLNNGQFRPCNIFIMKSDMFYKYCEFVFGVLEKYNNIMHFNNDIDVFNYVLNNIPKYCENKSGMLYSINYQARIQAFLMERISNIFYNKNFKNPYLAELVLTEQNFEIETEFFKLYEK